MVHHRHHHPLNRTQLWVHDHPTLSGKGRGRRYSLTRNDITTNQRIDGYMSSSDLQPLAHETTQYGLGADQWSHDHPTLCHVDIAAHDPTCLPRDRQDDILSSCHLASLYNSAY